MATCHTTLSSLAYITPRSHSFQDNNILIKSAISEAIVSQEKGLLVISKFINYPNIYPNCLFSGKPHLSPFTLSLSLSQSMAVVIGNLALLLDVISPRTVILDRKTRPVSLDVVLNLPKRDPHHHQAYYASITSKSFDSDGEARHQRVVARGKSKSKVNGVDFDASSSDEEGNGNGEGDEESFDWEKEMRRRVKEIEERKELEKKAEELQSRMEEEGGEGGDEGKEETEEEKRARVRKELEKVS